VLAYFFSWKFKDESRETVLKFSNWMRW